MSNLTDPTAAAAAAAQAAEFALLETAINAATLSRWCVASAFGLLVYDWLLTFDREVKFVWLDSRQRSKYIYIVVRYLGLAMLGFFSLGNSLPIDHSDKFCWQWFYIWITGGTILTLFVQLILQLRIYALYSRNKKVMGAMLFLFIIEVASLISILAIGMPKSTLLQLPRLTCLFIPSKLMSYFWIPTSIFEFILFVLVLYKSYNSYAGGFRQPFGVSKPSFMQILVRDSVLIFAFLFIGYIVNLLLVLVGPVASSGAGIGYTLGGSSLLGSRMLLNMREAFNRSGDTTHISLGSLEPRKYVEQPMRFRSYGGESALDGGRKGRMGYGGSSNGHGHELTTWNESVSGTAGSRTYVEGEEDDS